MAVDRAATIAILGAGPIGIEAALYGRFLGFHVDVYEQGEIANHVRSWGHVRLFSPFAMNCSPLALAALAAQDPKWCAPDVDALLTGKEYVEQFLIPLAQTDLLSNHIHTQTTVLSVGRAGVFKTDYGEDRGRENLPFLILLQDSRGSKSYVEADIVIDTTGTYGQHRFTGSGGIPAIGEREFRQLIDYRLPDLLGDRRADFAGQHILVLGAGYSAATSVVALADLARFATNTRITWATRSNTNNTIGPLSKIQDDRLVARAALTEEANRLALDTGGPVDYMPGKSVYEIRSGRSSAGIEVVLSGQFDDVILCDRIIANVGFYPDQKIFQELQVQTCYVTEGPIRLAADLLGGSSLDCLDQCASGPETLITTEPNFYILGSKSYGRNSRFLIATGLEQIQQLFSLICEQENLNLYQEVEYLIPKNHLH